MTAPSLDGRAFDLVSSTASEVDAAAPTRFRYRERDGIVWGDYAGDTVVHGRMVGVRDGEVLRISFVHLRVAGGPLVAGDAESRIEHDESGPLRLVERFEVDGQPQTSICVEVHPAQPDGRST